MAKADPTQAKTALRWQAIREIFDEALELAGAEREAYLARVTADPVVRAEVLRMLASWERAQSWFDRAGETVAKIATGPSFAAGDLLAGRYVIRRFIASGGMGEVYEADDRVLGEAVALKTLRPALAANKDASAGFLKEIQLSRAIKSPWVCRVHDVESHVGEDGGEVVFYTMELLEGETLAARLREKGAFPLKEARPVIREMALGLDAAHQAGILHRDFKPANVMLTPKGAVITDFGLALRSSQGKALVDAATPAYAAPEQIAGGVQSEATDIYSFGVTVFEMLYGRLPEQSSAGGPKILQQCLAGDPKARPGSALRVAEALGAMPAERRWTRRAIWAIPAAALAGTIGYRAARPARPILPGGVRVLVADAATEPMVTVLLRHQLSQSGALNPVEPDEMREARARIGKPTGVLTAEEWRQVALRAGATALVFADVKAARASFRVEALGDSTRTPLASAERELPVAGNEALVRAVQDASVWIRENAGEPRGRILETALPVDEITTGSWDALKEYVAAENTTDTELQLAHLHAATQRDPQFALAWMRLGDVYYSTDRDADGQACYRKAIATTGSHLAPREEFRIRAFYANDQWDYPEADRQFRMWGEKFPTDLNAKMWRISELVALKRGAEAVEIYSGIVKKDPKNVQAWEFLALTQLLIQKWDDMTPALARLRELKRPDRADRWDWVRLVLQGKAEEGLEMLEGLFNRTRKERQVRLAFWVLWFLGERRDIEPAVQRAEEFLKLPVAGGGEGLAGDLYIAAASVFAAAGRPAQRTVDLLEKALAWGAGPNHAYRAGVVLCRIGQADYGRRILARYFPAPETVKEKVWALRLRGHVQLAAGDATGAVRFFEQARTEKTNRIEPEWGLIAALRKMNDKTMLTQAENELKSEPAFFYWWEAPEITGFRRWLT